MNDSRKLEGRLPRAIVAVSLVATMVMLFAVLGGVGLAQNGVSAAQYQYGKKTTICHKGKKSISVGNAAVPAHLGHGDTVGSCTSAAATAKKAKQQKAAEAKAAAGKPATPAGKGAKK